MHHTAIYRAVIIFALTFIALGVNADSHSNRFGTRVIGGGSANPNNNSVVMLFTKQGNLCSGSVISSRAILTAAHCAFIGSRKGTAKVRGKTYSLTSGRRHSSLDVGIVYTSKNISASRFNIPSGIIPGIGQRFLVMGYGQPRAGRLSYGYMEVSEYFNGAREFIADSVGGSNACPGDSGGPAIVRYQNKDTIIGVVSRGPAGCRSGSYVIFPMTTTSAMARWIRTNS